MEKPAALEEALDISKTAVQNWSITVSTGQVQFKCEKHEEIRKELMKAKKEKEKKDSGTNQKPES